MKIKYILLIIYLFQNKSNAQSFNYISDGCFGSKNGDVCATSGRINNYNVMVGHAGDINPSGDKTVYNCDNYDIWIIALDDSLQKKWDNSFGGIGFDEAFGVVPYKNGIVISGHTTTDSTCNIATHLKGSYDYLLLFIDSNGNKTNELRFGSVGEDMLCKVENTLDGGLILTGISRGVHSFDKSQNAFYYPFQTPFQAAYDYWVIKLDSLGNKQWDRIFGGPDGEWPLNANEYGMSVLSDSCYLIYGETLSGAGGTISSASYGGKDAVVFKIDKNGNIIWDKRFGGNSSETISKIVEKDNFYYLWGRSASTYGGTIINQGLGSMDMWLMKTDTAGNLIWEKKYGTNSGDLSWDIVTNHQGGFFALGDITTSTNGTFLNVNYGSDDYVIMSLDTTGALLTYKIFGATHQDYPNKILLINDSTMILTGHSYAGNSNVKNCTNGIDSTSSNFWAVKVGYSTTTTSLNQLQNNLSLTVRPNPAKDQIAISGLPPASYVIQTYNIDGRLVMSDMVTSDLSLPLSIETLQSGMYITNIKNEKLSTTVRWVKE
ncbi:MAG: T9SS type A sorting domain-containing protein [Bacteroidota bacterium]